MPIIAKSNKTEFTAAPEGLWPAVCCDINDLGMVKSQWGESHQVELRFQLEDLDPKTGKRYMVLRRFRLSLHEKSSLRPILESWRGRKFTKEEAEGFDLEKLIGVNCQIQVIHNVLPDGAVFANIQAIVPAAKGAPKLTVVDYIRVCDRDRRDTPPEITDEDIPF